MRATLTIVLAFIALALVQTSCFYALRFTSAVPDLFALLAVQAALHSPKRMAALLAGLVGFLADQLTLAPMGICTVVFALGGMWITSIRQDLLRDSAVTYAVLSAVLSFAAQVAALLYTRIVLHGHGLTWTFIGTSAVATSLLTGLAGALLGRTLNKWQIGMNAE